MTPHEHMTKRLRTVAGGIAWERCVFDGTATLASQDLVDAAVDIAWTRLMPDTLERPALEVARKGRLLVFRIPVFSLEEMLAQAA